MKKLIPLVISVFALTTANAQFWVKKESVKIFNVELNAKEVNGQKRFVGSSDNYRSDLLNPLIEKNTINFLNDMGTFRANPVTAETRNLFDYSTLSGNNNHLDNIDFRYYENRGFDKLIALKPSLANDSLYKALRNEVRTENDISKKKKILFQDKYRDLRLQLISSRYEINPKPFTLNKSSVSKFTAELVAKVDSLLVANNVSGNGNVRAYLSKLADESTNISGIYYNVSLDNIYVGMINSYVENNITSIREDAQKTNFENNFSQQLMKVISQQNAVITSSLVAIQLKGNIDNSKVDINEISTKLETEFQIPAQRAVEISASIAVTFERHETTRFINDFDNVYIIRYFSSDEFKELKKL